MSAQPRDQEQRVEAATWTRGPVLVEAAAGTGKTTLLVERILYLIRKEGVPIDEIAAITFTRKATAELKDRIRSEILSAVEKVENEDDEARARLQGALDNLESARISTITASPSISCVDSPWKRGFGPTWATWMKSNRTRGATRPGATG